MVQRIPQRRPIRTFHATRRHITIRIKIPEIEIENTTTFPNSPFFLSSVIENAGNNLKGSWEKCPRGRLALWVENPNIPLRCIADFSSSPVLTESDLKI